MRKEILKVENLSVDFLLEGKEIKINENISFSLNEGEIFCLIGESGSGKSILAMTILGLLPENAKVKGKIFFEEENILKNKKLIEKLRGKTISWIPQNPSSFLNPLLKVGYQVAESMVEHLKISFKKAYKRVKDIFLNLNLIPIERKIKAYPHELSGGQKQRVLIGIGISTYPKLIIADEPTKGLDPIRRYELFSILKSIKKNYPKTTFLIITHDLLFAKNFSTKIGIMYKGEIVEISKTKDFFEKPLHPYSQILLKAFENRFYKIEKIEECKKFKDVSKNTCKFFPFCKYKFSKCLTSPPYFKVKGNLVRCYLYA